MLQVCRSIPDFPGQVKQRVPYLPFQIGKERKRWRQVHRLSNHFNLSQLVHRHALKTNFRAGERSRWVRVLAVKSWGCNTCNTAARCTGWRQEDYYPVSKSDRTGHQCSLHKGTGIDGQTHGHTQGFVGRQNTMFYVLTLCTHIILHAHENRRGLVCEAGKRGEYSDGVTAISAGCFLLTGYGVSTFHLSATHSVTHCPVISTDSGVHTWFYSPSISSTWDSICSMLFLTLNKLPWTE